MSLDHVITIRQAAYDGPTRSWTLELSYNGCSGTAQLADPFVDDDELELTWALEEYPLRQPFELQRALGVQKSVTLYAESLLAQLRNTTDTILPQGASGTAFTLAISDSPGLGSLHRLHWEALERLDSVSILIRRHIQVPDDLNGELNPDIKSLPFPINSSKKIHLILFTARSTTEEDDDVSYTLVSRVVHRIISSLPDDTTKLRLVRPGTFSALEEALKEVNDAETTKVVHFDCHGSASAKRSYLMFLDEDDSGQLRKESSVKIGKLLHDNHVSMVIMNACDSAQAGYAPGADLAAVLLQKGVPCVVGMKKKLLTASSEPLLECLYRSLFHLRMSPVSAIYETRRYLHANKTRAAVLATNVQLEDYLIPVLYEQSAEHGTSHSTPMATDTLPNPLPSESQLPHMVPRSEMIGRDFDLLRVETALTMQSHVIELTGTLACGKTHFIRHASTWWEHTGFVDHVIWQSESTPLSRLSIAHTILHQTATTANPQPVISNQEDQVLEEALTRVNAGKTLLVIDQCDNHISSMQQRDRDDLIRFLQRMGEAMVVITLTKREKTTLDFPPVELPTLGDDATRELALAVMGSQRRSELQSPSHLVYLNQCMAIAGNVPLLAKAIGRELGSDAQATPRSLFTKLACGGCLNTLLQHPVMKRLLDHVDRRVLRRLADREKKVLLSLATSMLRVCKTSPHLRKRLGLLGVLGHYQDSALPGHGDELTDPLVRLLMPEVVAKLSGYKEWNTVMTILQQDGLLFDHDNSHWAIHPLLPFALRHLLKEPQFAKMISLTLSYEASIAQYRSMSEEWVDQDLTYTLKEAAGTKDPVNGGSCMTLRMAVVCSLELSRYYCLRNNPHNFAQQLRLTKSLFQRFLQQFPQDKSDPEVLGMQGAIQFMCAMTMGQSGQTPDVQLMTTVRQLQQASHNLSQSSPLDQDARLLSTNAQLLSELFSLTNVNQTDPTRRDEDFEALRQRCYDFGAKLDERRERQNLPTPTFTDLKTMLIGGTPPNLDSIHPSIAAGLSLALPGPSGSSHATLNPARLGVLHQLQGLGDENGQVTTLIHLAAAKGETKDWADALQLLRTGIQVLEESSPNLFTSPTPPRNGEELQAAGLFFMAAWAAQETGDISECRGYLAVAHSFCHFEGSSAEHKALLLHILPMKISLDLRAEPTMETLQEYVQLAAISYDPTPTAVFFGVGQIIHTLRGTRRALNSDMNTMLEQFKSGTLFESIYTQHLFPTLERPEEYFKAVLQYISEQTGASVRSLLQLLKFIYRLFVAHITEITERARRREDEPLFREAERVVFGKPEDCVGFTFLVQWETRPLQCLVEDPATGLFRPRDHMQSLEARVAYLEGLLQQVRPDVALDHLAGLEKPHGDLSPSATFPELPRPSTLRNDGREPIISDADAAEGHQHDASLDPEDPADQLSADVALLCLTTASKEPHYFGPSSAVSFSRVVSAAMNLPKKVGGSQASLINFSHGNSSWEMATPFPISFPSSPLGTTLSQAYFNNIHPQYPFLHRPTFRFWEELCFKADSTGNLSLAGDIAQFFVWMVYAIASLALGPTHYDTAESYYSMALAHQPSVLELDGIESIQSLLCCAVYSIRSPAGGSLWKLSGLAIRYSIELGYHRSASTYRKNSNPLIAEMSKRCFWVAYDIDRVASFILGRPVGIPDDCIDAELPLDINDEQINALGLLQSPRASPDEPPTNMTGAIHVIKLRRLWSKIGNSIYPTITKCSLIQEVAKKPLIDQLDKELENWHAEIPQPPDTAGLDPLSVFASREWFKLAYDHSVLLLYRYWITHKPPPGEEESVEHALETCSQKAREICLLYRRLFQYQSMQFTWGSLHILFLGGLTYLYCIWKSARVRQAAKKMDVINTCMACNTALVIIAERWSKATPYRDIFEVLSEKTIGLVCGDEWRPQGGNSAVLPTSHLGAVDSQPLEDWIMELGASDMPTESEWFVQQLLQGMRNTQTDITAEVPPTSLDM
ncbi:hypothetical protein CEP54_015117 [Fusarium duplospermum]|uniref:Xylanolytic transcriptional activator regulatory domain-containing protein n=1 Tax=Fusarium duplospermum TaxID=1325734 RepID=A0A428NRG2_9HYPO|nr:hypothetical protein CEP54_015117 [Fusarium duplospermum]